VESALHLGHILHESDSLNQDVRVKRANFIEESTKVRETFGFASPTEVLKAVKVYVGSHYGSNLWQLDSDMANQYYSAWRTCVKLAWQVPRATHTYFVDHLLSGDLTSVRTDALVRYAKFLKGLRTSPAREVAIMYGVVSGDVQTTTGHTVNLVKWETGLNPIVDSSARVTQVLVKKVTAVPDRDKWRLGYLGKMLETRGEAYYAGSETELLTILIDSLCSS
jgi:hypothetical protein